MTKRENKVEAKGKGLMQTYWLMLDAGKKSAATDDTTETSFSGDIETSEAVNVLTSEKISSLIKWNVAMLARLLEQIITTRKIVSTTKKDTSAHANAPGKNPLDEVVEVISLPEDCGVTEAKSKVRLSLELRELLEGFVSDIAAMYKENPFHNFEHASHVTMSVVKLLSRIVQPPKSSSEFMAESRNLTESENEDHSYGITSDPLTQFACVFSALIHDVDHPGVPNTQLVKEGTALSEYYNGRSVAEQNSVDLAWDLFMRPDYIKLRQAICATPEELQRFRQLVVNSVMATDVMDKQLKILRNLRWDRAFAGKEAMAEKESACVKKNRKATIVIEHLIQASDVVHTMQHWQYVTCDGFFCKLDGSESLMNTHFSFVFSSR